MVWTAPYGIALCQNEVVEISDKGAVRGPDYPHWNGYVEAFFSVARGRCRRAAGVAPEAAAQWWGGIFRQATADGDRDGGLRRFAFLGAGTAQAGSRGEADGAAARQGLRQAQQERWPRRRGAVRGDEPANDAVRGGQERGTAGGADAARAARAVDRPAHPAEQCYPQLCGGVRPDHGQGTGQDRAAAVADRAG